MSSPFLLSIIVVSYNTQDLTVQTLRTAIADIRHSRLLHNKTEIYVVDNNSHDDSVAACKAVFKELDFVHGTVIANKDNLGFAKANNQAARLSKGQFVLLLNSDTVTQPGALQTMVQTFLDFPIDETTAYSNQADLVDDRLGMLSPQLLNPDGTLQRQGGDLPSLLSVFAQMSLLDDVPLLGMLLPSTQHTGQHGKYTDQDAQELLPMGWIAGTALMIRRAMADEIGWLDENIFMYGEDMEYCLRAKQHHWDVAIQPKARIIHYGCASSSSENAILGEIKGYLYIWSKHQPLWQMAWLKRIIWFGTKLRWLLYTVLGKKRPAEIYAKANKLVQ